MTIGKKLYLGFGSILAIMLFLFIVNIFSVQRQYSTHSAVASTLSDVQTIESVRYKMIENRLFLSNYLLSGDVRDEEKTNKGIADLEEVLRQGESMAADSNLRSALTQVAENEQNWAENFAKDMIAKRHQVDAGHVTVSDLQAYYLQHDPASWINKSTSILDDASRAERREQENSNQSSDSATMLSAIFTTAGTLIAVLMGGFIAFYTAKSIKDPLHHLIEVAHKISETGDLDQSIDIHRNDEVGMLAENFNKMIKHLGEMASVSAAIAEGELSVTVQPRSQQDTMAKAFTRMTQGLRESRPPGTGQRFAGGERRGADGRRIGRIRESQRAGRLGHRRSHQHDARDEHQRAKRREEHAGAGLERFRNLRFDRSDGHFDSARRGYRQAARRHFPPFARRSETGMVTMDKATTASTARVGHPGFGRDHRRARPPRRRHRENHRGDRRSRRADQPARPQRRHRSRPRRRARSRLCSRRRRGPQARREIHAVDQGNLRADPGDTEGSSRSRRKHGKEHLHGQEGLLLNKDLGLALDKISDVVSEVYKFSQEIGAATMEQSNGSSQIAKATNRLTEITQEINSSVEEQAPERKPSYAPWSSMRELVQQSTSSSTESPRPPNRCPSFSRVLLESMDRFSSKRSRG